MGLPLSPSDVTAASERLRGRIRRTPVLVDGDLRLKLEHTQHSGSFKARGALNSLLVTELDPAVGVVAASGGNHGAAVAWAAGEIGVPATIFVPEITGTAKLDRLRALGARVEIGGSNYAEALTRADEFVATTGAPSVHAYDQASTLAGAATMTDEFLDQSPEVTAVVLACGGGGLAGGAACRLAGERPLWVVETEGTAAFARALDAGRPVEVAVGGICADALGASRLGELPWQALSAVGARSIVLRDADVANARDDLWDRYRLIAEPAGAAAYAAVRVGAIEADGPIAVTLCGANTTLG